MRRSRNEYEMVGHGDMPDFRMFLVRIAWRNAHSHREFELCLVVSGSVRVFTSRRTRVFSEGELFIVNPHETHEIQAVAGAHEREAILLSLQTSPRWCERFFPKLPYVEFGSAAPDEPLAAAEAAHEISMLLKRLALAYFSDGMETAEGREFFCFARIADIFCLLMKHVPHCALTEGERASRAAKSDRAERITDYIGSHFTEKILLADIARREGLTLAYLSHFFRDSFGMSFQRFVTLLRFDEARRLVERTDMPITDIGIACGFSDYRYLNKIYAEKIGCNPAIWRKQHADDRERTSVGLSETDKHAKQRFFTDEESVELLGKI
jgi:AraC-like DNA-binding protein